MPPIPKYTHPPNESPAGAVKETPLFALETGDSDPPSSIVVHTPFFPNFFFGFTNPGTPPFQDASLMGQVEFNTFTNYKLPTRVYPDQPNPYPPFDGVPALENFTNLTGLKSITGLYDHIITSPDGFTIRPFYNAFGTEQLLTGGYSGFIGYDRPNGEWFDISILNSGDPIDDALYFSNGASFNVLNPQYAKKGRWRCFAKVGTNITGGFRGLGYTPGYCTDAASHCISSIYLNVYQSNTRILLATTDTDGIHPSGIAQNITNPEGPYSVQFEFIVDSVGGMFSVDMTNIVFEKPLPPGTPALAGYGFLGGTIVGDFGDTTFTWISET